MADEIVDKNEVIPVTPEPRTVTRGDQEVTVETRTGTGATVEGLKTIAGEGAQRHVRLHEVVIPTPPEAPAAPADAPAEGA